MQLIRIRTDDELTLYKDIWDQILAREHNDNPFIEYAWFYNWWKIIGRKKRVELYAVKEEENIIAFFSIHSENAMGGKDLRFCR